MRFLPDASPRKGLVRSGALIMYNSPESQDFSDIWQEIYEELCVLKCQVCGLSQDYLPDELQFGLHVQVNRLFELHNRIFKAVRELS